MTNKNVFAGIELPGMIVPDSAVQTRTVTAYDRLWQELNAKPYIWDTVKFTAPASARGDVKKMSGLAARMGGAYITAFQGTVAKVPAVTVRSQLSRVVAVVTSVERGEITLWRAFYDDNQQLCNEQGPLVGIAHWTMDADGVDPRDRADYAYALDQMTD